MDKNLSTPLEKEINQFGKNFCKYFLKKKKSLNFSLYLVLIRVSFLPNFSLQVIVALMVIRRKGRGMPPLNACLLSHKDFRTTIG